MKMTIDASVVLTFVTDSMGFFLFLGLATLLLRSRVAHLLRALHGAIVWPQ